MNERVRIENGKIIVKKNYVDDFFKDNVNPNALETSKSIMNNIIRYRDLFNRIISRKECRQCESYADGILNGSGPFGSQYAKIVFVNKTPTLLECARALSNSEISGYILSLQASLLKDYTMNDFYFTDFIKCPNINITENACKHCIENYFCQEIDIIKPSAIVFQGLNTIRILQSMNIVTNLPEKIEYGIIYDVLFNGLPTKIMGIYSIEQAFSKQQDVDKNKRIIWNNILSIVQSINN